MSGETQPEILVEDEELEEDDRIKNMMLTTPDSVDIVIHVPDCASVTYGAECDCTPITLRRGAKA